MYYGGNSAGNVAVGQLALYGASGTNNATANVAVGAQTLTATATGDYNVAIGYKAGDKGNSSQCILIGNLASGSGATQEIVIGSGTSTYENPLGGAGTETIRIGRASDFITCDFGENATWTHSSDVRIKKAIKDTTLGLDFILKLKPKEFKKKAPADYPSEFEQYDAEQTERKNPDKTRYGFIAQEVKEAMDNAGHPDFTVWSEGRDGMQELGEVEFITPLVKSVQELSSENRRLENKINDLEIFIMDKLGDDK